MGKVRPKELKLKDWAIGFVEVFWRLSNLWDCFKTVL